LVSAAPPPVTGLGCLLLLIAIMMGSGPAFARGESIPKGAQPVRTTAPTLTGMPTVGQTLSCSTGAWAGEPSSFGFLWLRDGNPVAGQTGSTYVVQQVDVGHSISCRVTASVDAGAYTIIGLPSGPYKVSFRAGSSGAGVEVGNYLTTYFHQEFAHSEANSVSVTAGAVTPGIGVAMPAGGEITGTVTDAVTHAGVAGINVCAETEGPPNGCTTTDAAGDYTLSGLATGSYSVWFSHNSPRRGGWSWAEFYNGRAKRGEADEVAVTAGNVTTGIDAEMHTGEITGTVRSAADTSPLAGVEVCAISAGEPLTACAPTNAAGEYTIGSLGGGAYLVQFGTSGASGGNYITEFYERTSSPSTAAHVMVVPGNTTAGIDAELETGGEITGRVTSESTHTPIEGVTACIVYTSASFESGPCEKTNGAGEYVLAGLAAGLYQVEFYTEWDGSSAPYLGEYFDGASSRAEATSVAVSAGTVTNGVDAELEIGGQITGTVTSAATGAGVGGIDVCALASAGMASRCGPTDAAGHYSLSGLASGSVEVRFIRGQGEPGNYLSQLYAGQVTNSAATHVPVTAGAVTSGIDAHLLAGGIITGRVTSAAGAGIAGVMVCAEYAGAFGEAFRNQTWGGDTECGVSSASGGSATATSNALAVQPGSSSSHFKLLKARFDPRTGMLDFYFNVVTAGRFRWRLSFPNADIGFAQTAARSATHGRRPCRHGYVMHRGRCLPALVAFSSGTREVHSGTVELQVRPDALARRALRGRRVLHVRGPFTFQSSLGGPPFAHAVALAVHENKTRTR
jgi:hypothetical protein